MQLGRLLVESRHIRLHHGTLLRSRRTLVTEALYKLGSNLPTEQVLDLAIALPLPQSFPCYTTTIVLVTVVSRLIFTVPFAVWAKHRQLVQEEVVVPQLRKIAPVVGARVFKEMTSQKYIGTTDEMKQEHAKRCSATLQAIAKELNKKYNCRPALTLFVAIGSQIPVFFTLSSLFLQLSKLPTPLDSESFISISSLAHPDPLFAFPILIGVLTMANVESSVWFRRDILKEHERKYHEKVKERGQKGERLVTMPSWTNLMRYGSLARIIISLPMPGGVLIYWATSGLFGLIQTWILDWWRLTRRKRLGITESSSSTPSTSPPHARKCGTPSKVP